LLLFDFSTLSNLLIHGGLQADGGERRLFLLLDVRN